MRIDKKTARLMASVRSLEEACQKMETASRLAQYQYNNSLVLLDELVSSAGRGEYKAPLDLEELVAEIKQETEAQVTLLMMRRAATPLVSPRKQSRVVVACTETADDNDSVDSVLLDDHSSFGSERGEFRDDENVLPLGTLEAEVANGNRMFSQFFQSNNTELVRPPSARPPPPPGFFNFGT